MFIFKHAVIFKNYSVVSFKNFIYWTGFIMIIIISRCKLLFVVAI